LGSAVLGLSAADATQLVGSGRELPDDEVLNTLQAAAAGSVFDHRGTEFWIGFPDNLIEGGKIPQRTLFITGDIATTGTVEVPGLGFSVESAVNPGQVTTVELPSEDTRDDSFDDQTDNDVEAELIAKVQQRGVHVTSAEPVTVYGLSRAVNTSDAFLALPVTALGTEYVNLGWPNSGALISFVAGTQLVVVGTQDATQVTIAPGAKSVSTSNSGVTTRKPSGAAELNMTRNNGGDGAPTVLTESGQYVLSVEPSLPAHAGTYSFQVLDLETAATEIQIGDRVEATLATGRETTV